MIENVFKDHSVTRLKVDHFYNDEDEAYKVVLIDSGPFSYTATVRNIDTQKEFKIKEWFFGFKKYEPTIKDVKK